jgi:hypothetical protein
MASLTILGYLCLMLTGVSLGLLGAGGAILGVPILVYLLAVPPVRATGYSLVLVGVTALVGAVQYIRRGYAHPRMAVVFGLPAILGVYLARRAIFPSIPDPALHVGAMAVSKDMLVMVIFAAFMAVAATQMIRSGKTTDTDEYRPHRYVRAWIIAALGFVVGVFAGFVGAGGGFMILPVLVLLGGLPMRMAIGTSLLIIAAQSLIGFIGEVQAVEEMDYPFILSIVVPPFLGIFVGTWLNRRAPATGLKMAFGWFLLVVGVGIVAREVWILQ